MSSSSTSHQNFAPPHQWGADPTLRTTDLDEQKKLQCFVDLEKAFDKSSTKGDGMEDEKERHIRKNVKGCDEPVSRSESESQSGNKIIGGICGESWQTPGVSVITTVVCNCGGSGYWLQRAQEKV